MTESAEELRRRVLLELGEAASAPEYRLEYEAAKAQASRIDALVGLRCEEIERSLAGHKGQGGQELWIGLPVQAMQTPYAELAWIIRHLKLAPEATWVDLGAAYGRLGLVLALLEPRATFIGYELVEARVDEGRAAARRLGCARASLVTADLGAPEFRPAAADCYFIYDFGVRAAVEKTLGDLKDVARARPIVVVGRGRGVRSWIERGEPWLATVVAPEHFSHFSIYRS